MFETGLWGVEGKPVGLGKLPRRSLSKDEGKVFSASKASSALAISCLCWVFGQRGRALIIDIWSSGGAGTNLADGMGAPTSSLAEKDSRVLLSIGRG
jgi:hypothetical protein